VIRLRDVHKHYRQGEAEVAAVDGVSLDVPRGAFLAVMGPSGSGKSTLLQLIAGLDTPTSGEIAIDERPLHRMPDDELTVFRRRHVGIVFQFFNLLPTLTAEENVGLPLVLDGLGARAVRPRALAMLERVGLAHRRRHFPDQLSGGEMQRVAIARALVTEPLVLLADEPTGNLDSKAADAVLGLVRDANETRGQTVILVTHDARAAAHARQVVELEDGRIIRAAET